jgi:glycosyltransferase involved in cell wall biosynthesis
LDTILHFPNALVHHFKIIRTFKPDFVYHNYYRTIIMLFPFLSRHKNIYHVGDLERVNLKNRLIFRLVQYKTKVFIASSEYVKKNLLDLGIEENKIRVVLNGIDTFDPVKKIRSDKIRIGIVGQIIARKGHMDVVEALHRLGTENHLNEIECLIYGDGDQKYIQSLRDRIKHYQLDQHFIFKGYQEEKSSIYENLDLVIVPSHYEAFGFSAIEPAFFKIPVIVSRTGGLNEIVVEGKTGFFFDPGNFQDLLDQIKKFIHNRSLINDMGDAAYHHALQQFTSKRMIDDIEKILTQQ